jgi:hypothetical protein
VILQLSLLNDMPDPAKSPAEVINLAQAIRRLVFLEISGPVRVGQAEPGGDLLRAPFQFELGLDLGPQPGIGQEPAAARAPCSFPGPEMCLVAVIDALVMRPHVPVEFPADGRWRPADPLRDCPDPESLPRIVAMRRRSRPQDCGTNAPNAVVPFVNAIGCKGGIVRVPGTDSVEVKLGLLRRPILGLVRIGPS